MEFIKNYSDVSDEINDLFEKGYASGEKVGFSQMDQLISFKKGATSYIYGTPASGKSEFWWECLINLSKSISSAPSTCSIVRSKAKQIS